MTEVSATEACCKEPICYTVFKLCTSTRPLLSAPSSLQQRFDFFGVCTMNYSARTQPTLPQTLSEDRASSPLRARRAPILIAVAMCIALSGCGEIQQKLCVWRLNKHLSGVDLGSKPSSPAGARRVFSQIASLIRTADLSGCNSRTKYGMQELYTASVQAHNAMSDKNVAGAALLSIFNAGQFSPLAQQVKQAQERSNSACKLLRQEGVRC